MRGFLSWSGVSTHVWLHKINRSVSSMVTNSRGSLYWHGLTLTSAWISNYIHYKLWDEITHSSWNFNGLTVEIWVWISNFIALNFPVRYTLSGIYCIGGPSEICRQSAEMRLAVSVGTTSVCFEITYVCFIPSKLLVFAVEPQYQHQDLFFIFVKSIIWRTHIKS